MSGSRPEADPEATAALRELVAAELSLPVAPAVARLAGAVAARFGKATQAVLFYGSALRASDVDGLMLDFYVIVDDYAAAYGPGWRARANALLPPNVFPIVDGGLSAKYAVLSAADLRRLCGPETRNPAVWARFAQPARFAWARDADSRATIADSVAYSAPALLDAAASTLPRSLPLAQLWAECFALTYNTELRSERAGRPTALVDADPARYATFTKPALAAAGIDATVVGDHITLHAPRDPRAVRDWARRRRAGKALHAARLLKAAFTFDGGLDYLAWKIGRHAGASVAIRPWHRRWPLLGGLALLPRLLRSGAVR